MNFRPIVPSTKSFTAGVTLSGRKHRITSNSWNGVRAPASPYLPGRGSRCGCVESYTARQAPTFAAISSGSAPNASGATDASLHTSPHILGEIHS
jgi:hypothetical protein